MANEVRVTSPTGGSKGAKDERYDLIPVGALAALARLFGHGAEKYEQVNGRDNWRNGYDWSLSYAALQRHLNAFWCGEENDEEGFPHLAAVMWHAMVLYTFSQGAEYQRYDNRQDKPVNFFQKWGEQVAQYAAIQTKKIIDGDTVQALPGELKGDVCAHKSYEERGYWRKCEDCGFGWPTHKDFVQ